MRRFVSVWLPHWPIERWRRSHRGGLAMDEADERPFVLAAPTPRGLLVTAASCSARVAGILPGLALADARARLPALASSPAEIDADAAALARLALWLGRYGPARNVEMTEDDSAGMPLEGMHGLWVDVAGVAHLFGGEAILLADLVRRLAAVGIMARAGLADTGAGAFALARLATTPTRPVAIAPVGSLAEALAPLAVDGLRLAPATRQLLRRLGLRRIGQLYAIPRAALERRFRDHAGKGRDKAQSATAAAAVLLRLDQALGDTAEPRRPLTEPPAHIVHQALPEPLVTSAAVMVVTKALCARLAADLDAAGAGGRSFVLTLYRVDGSTAEITLGTACAVRDPYHLMRLFEERLDAIDAGFGIDVMALAASRVGPLGREQAVLIGEAGCSASRDDAVRLATLVDRLVNRLGETRVQHLVSCARHIPELAEVRRPAIAGLPTRTATDDLPPRAPTASRPPFLLTVPEPITVTAEVPEGAPARFTWRRLTRRVVRAEGPERIAPEWWLDLGYPRGRRDPTGTRALIVEGGRARAPVPDGPHRSTPVPRPPDPQRRSRDYYRLEDEGGRRYWVFRAGLYGEEGDTPPTWYVHGLYG